MHSISMELCKIEYNGFVTHFYVTASVQKYLEDCKIALLVLVPTPMQWYEHELFDLIDKNEDDSPDKEFGTKFAVVYCGIIEKWIDKSPKGFSDKIALKGETLSDGHQRFSAGKKDEPVGIRYRVLKINSE